MLKWVRTKNKNMSSKECSEKEKIIEYRYCDAIELAGNGMYNFGLLATLSLALLAMALDMFSFSIVVSLSSCDLQLNHAQKSILVSVPFIGPIIMAYAWGYISDTKGRRSSLLVALWVSFVTSLISSFSPNWVFLAICRLTSTCFCVQSVGYALLGESCSDRVKGTYMLIMTSIIHLNFSLGYVLAYIVTSIDLTVNLGLMIFAPWRQLIFIMTLPLGISAFSLGYYYESPKFVANSGHPEVAVDILSKIFIRNGGEVENYPVRKLAKEEGNVDREIETSLLESLWNQTAPLFRSPLLGRTMLLYYLIFVLFSSNSSLCIWFPFLAESFSAGFSSSNNIQDQGLCSMINTPKKNVTIANVPCKVTVDLPIVLIATATGVLYSLLNVLISKQAGRKRTLMIVIFMISCVCAVGALIIPNNVASVVMYLGILLNCLTMGVAFSYWVELYPTSYRGMAACLGVMVGRLSSIVGVNMVGPFIRSHCEVTFFGISLLLFSGVGMSYFLPCDNFKKI